MLVLLLLFLFFGVHRKYYARWSRLTARHTQQWSVIGLLSPCYNNDGKQISQEFAFRWKEEEGGSNSDRWLSGSQSVAESSDE